MFRHSRDQHILMLMLIAALILSAGGAAAFSKEGREMQDKKTFVHTVLFWLNDKADEKKQAQMIEDCRSLLGKISTVRYLAVGPPAGTSRGVVDNSYDVGLVVHFADKAGHDHYQNAEQHLRFIERNQDIWQRVQVYDILAE